MTFTVGINIPCINDQYDHDFGYNMTRKPDITYEPNPTFQNDKEDFEKYIKDVSESGVKTVRLWLFERFEGLSIVQDNVVGPDSKLIYNLIDALQILQIPDIQNQTWAIDVLNEPEGLEQNQHDDRRKSTGIHWDDLINFVEFALGQIKEKTGLAVSCGFQESMGLRKAKNRIANLVGFFDFHMYDDEVNLPMYDSLGISKPCIIGECGHKTKKWDDNLQRDVVAKFLKKTKEYGYSGCFVWEYGFLGVDKSNKEKTWSMINPDGSHRPAFEEIKNL